MGCRSLSQYLPGSSWGLRDWATAPQRPWPCNWAAESALASGYDPDGNLLVTRTVEGSAGCGAGTLLRSQS
ncbi:MAG TPA: hypothetical protein VK988_05915, partial [Acidimicrobiales bacterium]|nr:hypothetical protein [Acidimicrobiales bacterium]